MVSDPRSSVLTDSYTQLFQGCIDKIEKEVASIFALAQCHHFLYSVCASLSLSFINGIVQTRQLASILNSSFNSGRGHAKGDMFLQSRHTAVYIVVCKEDWLVSENSLSAIRLVKWTCSTWHSLLSKHSLVQMNYFIKVTEIMFLSSVVLSSMQHH